MGKPSRTIEQLKELMLKNRIIDPTTGCWLWIGKINKDGYGVVSRNAKYEYVHRLSAYIYLGFDLYSSLQINHKRECPHKNCFFSEHLYVGTHRDNMEDAKAVKLYCKYGHTITGFHRRVNGYSSRECVICRSRWGRNYKKNKKSK